MKRRNGLVLFLLLALALGLQLRDLLAPGTSEKPGRPGLQYEIQALTLLSSNDQGQPELQLQASLLRKEAASSQLQLEQPVILLHDASAAQLSGWQWRIQARQGVLSEKSEWVRMHGQVTLRQLAQEQPVLVETEALLYLPASRQIQTDQRVNLNQEGLHMQGLGMLADLREQTVLLHRQIEGQYDVE